MAGWICWSRADLQNKQLIQQSFEVALQTASVHIGTDGFKVLNGELAGLQQESEGFSLALVQTVFLHQHVSADNLFTALFNFDHLGFESGDEIVEPAGHAYIGSQRAEGWIPVADDYDDPVFSGGNMERPALQRMMADIDVGKIDVVVIYKIDRLTRSLADFSKMVEVFERYGVSFVSVTQQFNTTTSMSRLMLNILLSFAQFEHEVTGERIRDKIAASERKGMWMGGVPPLGYDVENRRLVPNEREVKLIRHIFQRFVELGSSTALVKELKLDGVTSKA